MIQWAILPFKRYFDFQGRSRRMEYWCFALLNVIVYLVLIAIAMAAGFPMMRLEEDPAALQAAGGVALLVLAILCIYALAVIIPSIAVVVRRLHDRDMSGWWYLGLIVASMRPIVNFIAGIAFLVLMFLPGTPGPNRFGPDPKDPTSAEVFA